jgi:hypothetical protein
MRSCILLLFTPLLSLAQPASPAAPPPPPVITSGLTEGSKKIEGRTVPLSITDLRPLSIRVTVKGDDAEADAELTSLWIDRLKGDFKLEMKKGLVAKKEVKIYTVLDGKESAPWTATIKEASPPTILINTPLREGGTEVNGAADADIKKVQVRAYAGWASESEAVNTASADEVSGGCLLSSPSQEPIEAAVDKGRFKAELKSPLNAGDCVLAIPMGDDWPPSPTEEKKLLKAANPARVQSVLLDWGRLRGYFTVGGIVSHYRQQFGQVDGFVGFTADAQVIGSLLCKQAEECEKLRKITLPSTLVLRDTRITLNWFTDARVAVKLASGANTGAPASTTGSAAAAAAVQAVRNYGQIPLPGNQPGFFQFGLHVPIAFSGMDFYQAGRPYSFFFGPMLKGGVHTLEGGQLTYRRYESSLDGKTQTLLAETQRGGAMPFYGYGGRFGLYEYDLLGNGGSARDRQVANNLIAYFDFTYGRSRGFLSYYPTVENITRTVDGKPTTLELHTIQSGMRPRFSIEGRIKIPYLPALVGVDANIRTQSRSDEPNELRFLVAFRIDAQRALGRVFGANIK